MIPCGECGCDVFQGALKPNLSSLSHILTPTYL